MLLTLKMLELLLLVTLVIGKWHPALLELCLLQQFSRRSRGLQLSVAVTLLASCGFRGCGMEHCHSAALTSLFGRNTD